MLSCIHKQLLEVSIWNEKLELFWIADFFAEQRRTRPNFLDAVNGMVQWKLIEKILHKKL